jgi:hypothetical protein
MRLTPVDDGMEALTCQVKFYGIDTDMLDSRLVSGSRSRFTAYQGYLGNGTARGTVEEIEGLYRPSRRMRVARTRPKMP